MIRGTKMAKKNRPTKQSSKKKKGWLIPIIILIVLIAIGGIFYLNRQKVASLVKDIPVLNLIFKEKQISEDPYDAFSPKMLKEKLKETEKVLEAEKLKVENLQNEMVLLQEKIDALKKYEENYNTFIEQKKAWDQELARNNPELFIEQFESFYKEEADNLYLELKGKEVLSKEEKELAKTISAMESDKAAQTIEKLLTTDTELVKTLLKSMKSEEQAKIFNEMNVNAAAQVVKLIGPMQ